MSIKTQKIIRFIPFVNLILITIQWFLFYSRNDVPNKIKRIIRHLLIVAAGCLIIMIIEVILDMLFNHTLFTIIINLLVSFADMYIFSSVLIYDQEKYYKEIQK